MAAGLTFALSACTSSTPQVAPSFPPPPGNAQLIAAAHLDPCPATSEVHAAKTLPDLTLPCLGQGPAVHLDGLRGLPTVLNIWATWCGPCQKETRYLAAVYDASKTRLRFLGVDTEDSPRSALDFAPHVDPPMRYPQVVDSNKSLLIALHLPSAVPTTVFIGSDGHVVHVSPGPYRSVAELQTDISRYLGIHA
jgi:thiol-disulfide isomerase/thioredoxin